MGDLGGFPDSRRRSIVNSIGILDQLWEFDTSSDKETIKTHITNLRRKLKAAGCLENFIEAMVLVIGCILSINLAIFDRTQGSYPSPTRGEREPFQSPSPCMGEGFRVRVVALTTIAKLIMSLLKQTSSPILLSQLPETYSCHR
ncbi:winged helix-turn-helix domain-containing protein [Phormidesmis priestleyi]